MSPSSPALSLGFPAGSNTNPVAPQLMESSTSPANVIKPRTRTGSNSNSSNGQSSSPSIPLLSLGLEKSKAQDPLVSGSVPTVPDDDTNKLKENDVEPPSVSMALDCTTDDHHVKSFALKRTRSMGVFDDYIRPQTDLVGTAQDYPHLLPTENAALKSKQDISPDTTTSSTTDSNLSSNHPPTSYSPASSSTSISTAKDSPLTTATTATTSSTFHHQHPTPGDDYEHMSNSDSPSVPGTPDLPNDDSVIHPAPQRLVDYFSHDWKESDVSSSWRYIVLRRKDVANSARLENASWRTWTKAKYNLKTVSPESVNWLKDYDVTWLYGPLYDEHPHSLSLTGSADNLNEQGDTDCPDAEPISDSPCKAASTSSPSLPVTKPILKKKTVTEMLGGSRSPILQHNTCNGTVNCPCDYHYQKRHNHMHNHEGDEVESSNYLRHHNYRHRPHTQSTEYISSTVNKQYAYPRMSEERLSTPSLHSSSSGSLLSLSVSRQAPPNTIVANENRSVHFNDRVDQCIVVDGYDSSDEEEGEDVSVNKPQARVDLDADESSEDENSDSEEEDEGGLFLMVRNPSSTSLHHHGMAQQLTGGEESALNSKGSSPALSATSSSNTSASKHHPTIALLPATRLKYQLDGEEEAARQAAQANSVAYSMVNHGYSRSGGTYRTYDYNSVYTSPGSSPDQSPFPSISSRMDQADENASPPASTSSRATSSQHTTMDSVMGQVQLNKSSSATGLLGMIQKPVSTTYGSSSFESEASSEFVEDTGVGEPLDVHLSASGQEALKNISVGDNVKAHHSEEHGRLGSAVQTAKNLWRPSSWRKG